MSGQLTYNEPAWAIDLASEIRTIADRTERPIKKATGEMTISGVRSLFPDLLLLGDVRRARILQGWELKFPDTPITDEGLLENAEQKARALGLNSFLVWNVTTAVLHVRNPETDSFEPRNTWSDLSDIDSRAKAREMETEDWLPVLERIIDSLNTLFETGTIEAPTLVRAFSDDGVPQLLLRNAGPLADYLKNEAATDGDFDAAAHLWWSNARAAFAPYDDPWTPLARMVLVAWTNRLLFAHVLKRSSTAARGVDDLTAGSTPEEALELFERLTASSDFMSIFQGLGELDRIDPRSWEHLLQLNSLLRELRLGDVDQQLLQQTLEQSVASSRRKSAGQYATPRSLARLLVRLVLRDKREGKLLDGFCGTGTIPRAAVDLRREYDVDAEDALERTWASDKFSYPLQMATMALADPQAMGNVIRVSKSDIIDLAVGNAVGFVDPDSGESFEEELPLFDCAASNLPFVRQEDIDDANPELRPTFQDRFADRIEGDGLSGRSDLYAYLPFFVWDLVRPDGYVGLILSNAWLGTDAGTDFRDALRQFFEIESVVVSACGRWFANSDVVTCILVLKRREDPTTDFADEAVRFCSLGVSVDDLGDTETCRTVSSEIILGESESGNVGIQEYEPDRISRLEGLGLTWSALFADLGWLDQLQPYLIAASDLFEINRGERRGWNPMFYPSEAGDIEEEYLEPVLKTMRSVDGLIAKTDTIAFCCSRTIEELEDLGHTGALDWIARFRHETNNKGRPLPDVLERAGHHWYEMKPETMADLVCTMNPGRRLFIARMDERGFVDQRLIRLTAKQNVDVDLAHALLNSAVGMFYLEALGFGRGLGALDLNATKLNDGLHLIDPSAISERSRTAILEAFTPLLSRPVEPVPQELARQDRRQLDEAVLEAVDLGEVADDVGEALRTIFDIRVAVDP